MRGSGIIVHPTSLPGPYGSGDIGAEAHEFVRWLRGAEQRYWQVLPLGPTGYGNSPYSAVSAFASNPLLIDLAALARRGWLPAAAIAGPPVPHGPIDHAAVSAFRWNALRQAAEAFFRAPAGGERDDFQAYSEREAAWLDDYALFMALHERHGGREWTDWPEGLARRAPDHLAAARRDLRETIRLHRFTQWVFDQQWRDLRREAAEAKVQMVGDLPIFVAFHSAEVWANPHLFHLGPTGRPEVISGVPPDYFSATGQRWGNPLYRWDVLASRGYDWWIDRFRAAFERLDLVRVDHFRGFAACWEIPATEPTAVKGRWVKGPGAALFDAVRAALGRLPIVAEDLGVITPEVQALRDRFDLPGMKVLQFAFGSGPANPFLPHNHVRRAVVYTGTHDNDTTLGWYAAAPEGERDYARRYVGTDGREMNWDLIRLAAGSVADVAVYPMQDVLGLGSSSRMNTPGLAAGNWGWRFSWDEVSPEITERLRSLTAIYGRAESPEPAEMATNEGDRPEGSAP